MESKSEAHSAAQGTVLGTFDVTLMQDPGGTGHATTTQVRSWSERVAREVPLVVGSLLFAQYQLRGITDPSRLLAVAAMANATTAVRENRLAPPVVAPGARVAASYHIDLLANGNFRVNVDEKIVGMLRDAAGGLVVGDLAPELLSTLGEPYRTFYREMLDAALPFWRERRPSTIEATWEWVVSLRRLDFLVRQGVAGLGDPVPCATCHALRPAGFNCLHCGAAPGPALSASALLTPSPVAAPPAPVAPPIPPREPVYSVPSAPIVSSPVPSAPTFSQEAPPERTILPARDISDVTPPPRVNERDAWPLASLPQRFGSFALDLISGAVLGLIGAFGVTAIFVALQAFGPDDSASSFAAFVWLIVFGLYLGLGWAKGETLGMFVFHLKLLRAGDRSTVNVFRSITRGIGSLILVGIALGIFVVLNLIDNNLTFIEGTADLVVRIIIGLISIYVLWLGSGQQILGDAGRQTLGDKVADTVVAVRP